MANEEHLALLRQGVEAWNQWKANNPEIRPNLSFATGNRITIREAKLSGVDLSQTNLSRVDLSRADLMGANLSEANLNQAYLSEVNLIGGDLSSADLSSADLTSANLIGVNLSKSYLSGADLRKANLSGVDFIEAKLIGAKLSGANLSGANLREANLTGASLRGANLKGANLKGANLTGANLTGANLQKIKASDTNFNKAILTGACLEDWHINSATKLDHVICDYIYLQTELKERRPINGNFAPGEFSKLFQKPLETINLIFRNGIDWQAFLFAFQKLQIEAGGNQLSIQSLENKNDQVLIIRVNVPPNTNKADIKTYIKQEYDYQLKAIDKEYRYQLQANYDQIALYRQQSANLAEMVKVLACRTINVEARGMSEHNFVLEASKYNHNGAKIDHIFNTYQEVDFHPSIQHNYAPEQKQSLTDTAVKIQKFLQQLEQTYPTNTPLEKQMVVIEVLKRIESNPTLKARVVGSLQDVSIEALKQLIDHPLANVLLTALEGYQEIDQS